MILGIDPGKKGALVLLDGKGDIVFIEDMPDIQKLAFDLNKFNKINHVKECYIEKVHAMPKDGVVSAFSFGKNYGEIIGVLTATGFNINYVEPKVWQRAAGIMKADKKRHVEIAQHAWPDTNFYGVRGGLKDGRADAALIASYGLGIEKQKKTFEESNDE